VRICLASLALNADEQTHAKRDQSPDDGRV